MSTSRREKERGDRVQSTTPVRQRTVKDGCFVENISFDKISLGLVGSTILVCLFFLIVFDSFRVLSATIALVSAVLAFLSIRENKRDREANVAPTLFVGQQEEEYGILNLGSGPAHELSVTVTDGPRDDYEPEDSEVEGKILRVDDFLSLEREDEPDYVHMEYRSNVGHKEYEVTRTVLSDGG